MLISPKVRVLDAEISAAGDFGDLPDWDLTDLYSSTDAPEFKRDMDWLEQACLSFAEDYEGKLFSVVGFTQFSSSMPKKVIYNPKKDTNFPEKMTISPIKMLAFNGIIVSPL